MNQILLIQTLALGDLILTTPLLAGLREKYPQAVIQVLANSGYSQIFSTSPDVDHFIDLPIKKLFDRANQIGTRGLPDTLAYLANWVQYLPKYFDLIINPCFNDLAGALSFLPQSPQIIGAGFTREGYLVFRGDWPACCYPYIHGPSLNAFHLVDAHCLAAGIKPPKPGLQLYLSKQELQSARQLLSALGAKTDDKIVAFHVGAGHDYRRWPLKSFIQLGRNLQKLNYRILLTGTSQELTLVNRMAEGLEHTPIVAAGKTDLRQLAGLLSHCLALVSNDTGPIHLGTALGVPCLSIFLGKAQFRSTGPYGPGNLALEADLECAPCQNPLNCTHLRCRETITVKDVQTGLAHLLGNPFDLPGSSHARFYRAFRAGDGWLDWQPLASNPKGKTISAFRQVWLELLHPGAEMAPPRSPLPPCPKNEPFVNLDLLTSQAINAANSLLSKLEAKSIPTDLQAGVQELSHLEKKIRGLISGQELIEPIISFFILRLAGLDSANPVRLVKDQVNLYRKIQTAVRLLAERLE